MLDPFQNVERSESLITINECRWYITVEQKSRADFGSDIKLPLSKLTATDNIMLGNHGQ
jgi:hypothetical protein